MAATETDAYNARQIVGDIIERLDVIEHEAGLIAGLLDDLAIYLPFADADKVARVKAQLAR